MMRLGPCGKRPDWLLDRAFHHTVELALDEKSVWTCGVSERAFPEGSFMARTVRDDALVRVSLAGELLEITSVSKILFNNGLENLVLGGPEFTNDPLHLNQISVARESGPYWQRGDLLLSTRHNNAVFLYRPATGKILWHRELPWRRQHSARFIDDHRISVFGNQTCLCENHTQEGFYSPDGHNRIFSYDFATDATSEPWADLLAKARPRTLSGGLATVLSDGGLFLEESDMCRLLRFTQDQLLWSLSIEYDAEHFSKTFFARYLTPEQVEAPLRALASTPVCREVALMTFKASED